MSAFRDAIATAIGETWEAEPPYMDTDSASAVLAMPDMQAIRQFIYRQANGRAPKMDHGRRQMQIWGLPQSVIEWVLSGGTP